LAEASPARKGEQERHITTADVLSVLRVPMALAFVFIPDQLIRLGILAAAAASDLLDGPLARRFGASRFGAFIDPLADKLFMGCAFGVVAVSGRLEPFEIVGVLLRDLAAAVAFITTMASGRPSSIPARAGGKAVTVAQVLTLLAFLLNSEYLRPLAWATAAVALYAIWDYQRVAPRARQRLDQ
jgi:CDP-diacylglycerol--glycerol-3-phosphate 3-phosphatidyltransferase/cardiolipin synthase